MPSARHALQLVLTAVGELHVRADHELLHGRGHKDLARSRLRADAGTDVDGQAAEVVSDRLALAGMDSAAQLDGEVADSLVSASAQRIAIAGPSNAESAPSPMCLTTRPPCSETTRSTSAS